MQVGDLVRHEMYSKLKTPALVVAVDDLGGGSVWIKLLDPTIAFLGTWDNARHYEVISESR
jgi:hypothetical protein